MGKTNRHTLTIKDKSHACMIRIEYYESHDKSSTHAVSVPVSNYCCMHGLYIDAIRPFKLSYTLVIRSGRLMQGNGGDVGYNYLLQMDCLLIEK